MWHKNLWKALLSSTGCPSPLLAIQIRSSSATFGRNFSRCRAPNCNSVPYTTHKQMAKRKSSIVASNSIYGVLFTSGHGYGVPTYLGLNIGITQHTIFRPERPLFRSYIEGYHLPFWRTMLAFHQYTKSTNNSWAEMNCYNNWRPT